MSKGTWFSSEKTYGDQLATDTTLQALFRIANMKMALTSVDKDVEKAEAPGTAGGHAKWSVFGNKLTEPPKCCLPLEV